MESTVKKKSEVAEIANPTYDVVFKYMMDDIEIAKLVISTIIGEDIEISYIRRMIRDENEKAIEKAIKEYNEKLEKKDVELEKKDVELAAEKKARADTDKALAKEKKARADDKKIIEKLNQLIKNAGITDVNIIQHTKTSSNRKK